MRIIAIVIMFFLLGAFFIISENKLTLKDKEARQELGKLYYSWLSNSFDNSKSLAGYVVKLDWLPKNIKEKK